MEMASATNDTSPGQMDETPAMPIDLAIATASQIIFGVLGVLGNALCFAVLRSQAKENNTNLLIVTQSVIDFITSIILISHTTQSTWYPYTPSHGGFGAELFCRVWNSRVATFSGFAISTFNLTIISIERYIAVVHPVVYMTRLKRRTLYIMAGVAWLIAPILQIMFAATTFTYDEKSSRSCIIVPTSAAFRVFSGVAAFVFEFFMPVVVMGFSFTRITTKLRTFKRVNPGTATASVEPPTTSMNTDAVPMQASATESNEMQALQPSAPANVTNKRVDNARPIAKSEAEEGRDLRRRNITITLLIVYMTYLVCWTPNQVTFFVYNVFGVPSNYLGSSLHLYTTILATFNICVNPFVYAFRYKAFKQGLKKTLTRCTKCQIRS